MIRSNMIAVRVGTTKIIVADWGTGGRKSAGAAQRLPGVSPKPIRVSPHVSDFDEQLRTLAKLKFEGVISESDWRRRKKNLIGA